MHLVVFLIIEVTIGKLRASERQPSANGYFNGKLFPEEEAFLILFK